MGEKIVVGPVDKGLRSDRTPFVIDNDNFPALINAYQWRGRVKRKRGTSPLTRLGRYVGTTNGAGALTVTLAPAPIVIGTVLFNVIGSSATDIFVDPGTSTPIAMLLTNGAGSGTLNLTTGLLTITGSQPNAPIIYYPSLPVMGLEEFTQSSNAFPGTLAFDTDYSYLIQTNFPYNAYDVSFYKNPPISSSLPGYTPKTTPTPTTWNGQNYQQFWTTNYQGALFATNGIPIPFNISSSSGSRRWPTTPQGCRFSLWCVGPSRSRRR